MNTHSTWDIERKFIVSEIPNGLLEPLPFKEIRQGYLSFSDELEIRIRDKSGQFSMTLKQGQGLKRLETQIAITAQQFEQLWPLTQGARVEKRRYKVSFFSHKLALDIFSSPLEDLVLAEVEFANEEESRHFLPPDFAEVEVTSEPAYRNVNLARHGMPLKHRYFQKLQT